MILTVVFGSLALLSLALLLWQWLAAARFSLHQRSADTSFAPSVTLLKSLKGCDTETENCLRSWFAQDYPGHLQILFGVASADDPVCDLVRRLIHEHTARDAQLIVVNTLIGPNAKVSKLAELKKLARHDIFVVSDADVRVPPDFIKNVVAPLRSPEVGLVNCFYRLANPSTLAMQWEAIAINADFWSQVLQSRSLKPLDFALGAVMVTRRQQLDEIGGFKTLANCLADDYQLGNRIARKGYRIELCPVVVECWDPPMTWRDVWNHQLRWARTIRVCQPAPYFFSILSNAGFWALLWLAVELSRTNVVAMSHSDGNGADFVTSRIVEVQYPAGVAVALLCIAIRIFAAFDLQRRLTRSLEHAPWFWLVPIKDLLQAAIWLCAFLGNRIEWRGRKFKLRRDGTLVSD